MKQLDIVFKKKKKKGNRCKVLYKRYDIQYFVCKNEKVIKRFTLQ